MNSTSIVGLILLMVGGLVLSVPAYGQPKSILDKTIFVDYGERFHADAYVVPTESPDSARIAVFFRMANDFLTFVKVTDPNDVAGNYKAPMAVGIEVRDTLGVIRQRHRWEDIAYTTTFDETNSKNAYHYGWVVLTVPPGSYRISLEILQQKESSQKKITIPTVSFNPSRPMRQLTAPLFVMPVSKGGVELLEPFVLSGNVAFSSRDARALILLNDRESVDYRYVIRQLPYGPRDIQWWSVSETEGDVRSSTTRFPRVSDQATTHDPYLEVGEVGHRSVDIALVEIPIPVTVLVPGNYQIELVRAGTTDTLTMPFRIMWEMMPLALRNIDYAINLMRYIVSEETVDSLDDGSDVERRTKLMGWWRTQDPTLTTTFNERLAEFYKRADQAFFAFSTIQEPDGANSERGRIYVLYGPPTDIRNELPVDGEARVVWTYANQVNKVITFGIDDKGIYRIRRATAFNAPEIPPAENR